MNYLAIDVGGTFTKYAVITEECRFLLKDKRPTQLADLELFLESIVELFHKFKDTYAIQGIALSMPGMIDSKNGFMYTGGNLEFIQNLNIVEVLEKRCNIKVTVENDAKCAAVAELWKGSLMDCKHAVVLVCGTGVGGAVIRNREVINGKHFMAGEFSYVFTESDTDYSMRNCLADNTGIAALIKYVAEETGMEKEDLDGKKIFEMANSKDEKAIKGLRKYVKNLAIQIHNYQYILDPQRFAIGGGISVQPLFLQMIQEELAKMNQIFPWTLPVPEVVVCKFFNDSNLIGAVYVHLKAMEQKISTEKINELLEFMGDRREAKYLRDFLSLE